MSYDLNELRTGGWTVGGGLFLRRSPDHNKFLHTGHRCVAIVNLVITPSDNPGCCGLLDLFLRSNFLCRLGHVKLEIVK